MMKQKQKNILAYDKNFKINKTKSKNHFSQRNFAYLLQQGTKD